MRPASSCFDMEMLLCTECSKREFQHDVCAILKTGRCMNLRKALWRTVGGLAFLGAALFATLHASQPGFRVYPSLEPYDDVDLPADYQEKSEWIFARLMYPEHPNAL